MSSPAQISCQLQVKVIPGASKASVSRLNADVLKVKVTAPALEGKANDAVVEIISTKLNCSRRQVEIVSGLKSREKRISVAGFSKEQGEKLLLESGDKPPDHA